MRDLVLLVADKNMQFALRGALQRSASLQIRTIDYEFRTHMGRDGGVRATGCEVLAGERSRFRHALLVLDFEGCGAENQDSLAVASELDRQLAIMWGDRAKAIVILPEVDVWLWGNDNALCEVFGWPLNLGVRDWLATQGFEFAANGKPLRPKEALEKMRAVHKQPRSSAVYEKVMAKISLQRCQDPAFRILRSQLQTWFPPIGEL